MNIQLENRMNERQFIVFIPAGNQKPYDQSFVFDFDYAIQTAYELREKGISCDVIPAQYNATSEDDIYSFDV